MKFAEINGVLNHVRLNPHVLQVLFNFLVALTKILLIGLGLALLNLNDESFELVFTFLPKQDSIIVYKIRTKDVILGLITDPQFVQALALLTGPNVFQLTPPRRNIDFFEASSVPVFVKVVKGYVDVLLCFRQKNKIVVILV